MTNLAQFGSIHCICNNIGHRVRKFFLGKKKNSGNSEYFSPNFRYMTLGRWCTR